MVLYRLGLYEPVRKCNMMRSYAHESNWAQCRRILKASQIIPLIYCRKKTRKIIIDAKKDEALFARYVFASQFSIKCMVNSAITWLIMETKIQD